MNGMKYTLGIDLGSSSIKVAIINAADGTALATSRFPKTEMEIQAPHSGWAEQSPEFWWSCTLKAIDQACKESKIAPNQISAIGIAYQMHGLVAIDRAGKVIRPSIIWCDSRATAIGKKASEQLSETQRAALLNSFGNFTAAKLAWIKEHEPLNYSAIDQIFLPGDYLAYRFSGVSQTTIGGLSEGIFWDFDKRERSSVTDRIFDFHPSLFPEVVPTVGLQCKVHQEASDLTGISVGTPITYRAGDQPNNALSLGVFESGEVAATGGTSGVVYAVTDQLIFDPTERINAFAHVNYTLEQPRIGLLMCINGTGIQYAWLRKLLAPNTSYEELEQIARSAPIGAKGLTALPFGNGAERIFQNQTVGGHLNGIDFNRHGMEDLLRAGLEGIAFTFQYGLDCLTTLGCQVKSLKVGNDNLFQSTIFSKTLATLSGCEIQVYKTSGAEGAAQAAAVGADIIDRLDYYQTYLEKVQVYEPDPNWESVRDIYSEWENQLKKQVQIDE